MKTKKLFLFITIVICMITVLSINAIAANPPMAIDIEALADEEGTGTVHIFSAALYSDFVLQMGDIGDYHSLGVIDLSKYDKVTVWYGADGGAQYYDDTNHAFLALTTTGGTQNATYQPIAEANIISQVNLENPEGNWANASMEVSMSIDSDYNGEVYLALNMAKIGDRQDGLAITEIEFSDSSYVPPTPEPTEEPTPTPVRTKTPVPTQVPATNKPVEKISENSKLPVIIGIVAIAVILIAVIVIIIKKKKK